MPFIELKSLNENEVFPGYRGRAIHTGTTTYMFWKVEAGAAVPEHTHIHEQVANVLQGVFELTVDGQTALLEPGRVAVIPPNVNTAGALLLIASCLMFFILKEKTINFKL